MLAILLPEMVRPACLKSSFFIFVHQRQFVDDLGISHLYHLCCGGLDFEFFDCICSISLQVKLGSEGLQ